MVNGTILDPALDASLNGTVNETINAGKELITSPGADLWDKAWAFLHAVAAFIRATTGWFGSFLGYPPYTWQIPGLTMTVWVDYVLLALAGYGGYIIMKKQMGQGVSPYKWLINSAVLYGIAIFI